MLLNRPEKLSTNLQSIPNGAAGVRATLNIMRQLVRENKTNIRIRSLALSLVKHNQQKDWVGEVNDLYTFVRDRIRYVKDIDGVETVHSPEQVLNFGQGDCDDKSILLATLLATIGHPSRFVAIGLRPRTFQHVFVETKIGNKWIPLETTEPVTMGWRPKGIKSSMIIYN